MDFTRMKDIGYRDSLRSRPPTPHARHIEPSSTSSHQSEIYNRRGIGQSVPRPKISHVGQRQLDEVLVQCIAELKEQRNSIIILENG